MKYCKTALAFFTVLAVPGQAFAVEYHCYAYAVDDESETYDAEAKDEDKAKAKAIEACEEDHDFCKIGNCHEHDD